jgi:hypothetical protein
MKQLIVITTTLSIGLMGLLVNAGSESPYKQSIMAESADVRAYVDRPPEVMRIEDLEIMLDKPDEAPPVEVQIRVRDYMPRGLSPVLIIAGEHAARKYRIVSHENNVTVLGFLLDQPQLLKSKGDIRIQYGDDPDTRSRSVGNLGMDNVKFISQEAAIKAGIIPRKAK